MNFLKNLLVLVIATTFSLGCVEKNNVKTFENSKTSIKEELEKNKPLSVNIGGIVVSVYHSSVKWYPGANEEKGIRSDKDGTITYSWHGNRFCTISLTKDADRYFEKKLGEARIGNFLGGTLLKVMNARFKGLISEKKIEEIYYYETKRERGFLAEDIPCRILTITIKHPGIWQGADRIKTIFFKDKEDKWCILHLINIDGKNPVNLLEEVVDVYVAPEHISTAKSTNNQG